MNTDNLLKSLENMAERYNSLGKYYESKDSDRHDPFQACICYEKEATVKVIMGLVRESGDNE